MWIEKYRPQSLLDVVGQENVVKIITGLAKLPPAEIPHLLLQGPPGVGKTTVAHALANDLGAEIREWNASTDRGIDVVRRDIISYAQTYPVNSKYPRKILFLDEADNLTPDAQKALRRVMEKYYKVTIFILSVNDPYMIIDAIHSRCAPINFPPLSKENLKKLARDILAKENKTIDEENLTKVVEASKGSARTLINLMVQYLVGGLVNVNLFNPKEYIELVRVGNYDHAVFFLQPYRFADVVNGLLDYFSGMTENARIIKLMLKLADYVMLNPQPDEIIGKKTITLFMIANYNLPS
jgi:replication factor C small subunit